MAIRNLTLADDEFKSAYVEGKFVLDCVEIRLTQNCAEIPATYSSPGYFLVGPENGAEARLVCLRNDDKPFDPFGSLKRVLNLRSGRMIPEEHYFKLEARDVDGNVWTNPTVNVQVQERESSVSLTVTCDYLRCEFPLSDKSAWTNMVLLEELDFPLNVLDQEKRLVRGDSSTFQFETASAGKAGGLSLLYDIRKGRLGAIKFSELYAEPMEPEAELPSRFEERLLESVRFVTATMFWPVMLETVKDGVRTLELSKARAAPRSKLIYPPLNPRGHDKNFYELLGSYYRYACLAGSGDEFTPLSKKLGGLYTLEDVWIDTVALVVSVAIESVLGDTAFDKVSAIDKEVLEQINKIFKTVGGAEADQKLRDRAIGAMSRMKSPGTMDKLHALVTAGALDERDPGIWKNLRNTAAHGKLHIDPQKMQELLDSIFSSMTMIYKLAFMRIGYAGKYTDYSQHGWPAQDFDAAACWDKLNEITKESASATGEISGEKG